jgi:hypothetical protein
MLLQHGAELRAPLRCGLQRQPQRNQNEAQQQPLQ